MNILIIGAPRSGTTLFATMIGSHPDISILNEVKSGAWQRALGRRHLGVKLCVPNHLEEDTTDRAWRRPGLKRLVEAEAKHFKAWDQEIDAAKKESMASGTLQQFLKMPESRVLAILRAPERSVASMQKRGGQPFDQALYRWLRGVEIAHNLMARAPERIAVVGFERLVQAPKEVMRACCDWLGVDYAPAMLNPHTPYYKMDAIDAGKAGTQDDAFRAQIQKSCPDQWTAYQRLLENALGGR